MNDYHVIGIGGLYLDVVASVSYDFIRRHGIALNEEQEVSQKQLRRVFSALPKKELFAGGSAANTVSGIAFLGARTGFFTKLADNSISQTLVQNFKEAGVELCCSLGDPLPPMSVMCLILTTPKGERSILFHAGNPTKFSDNELGEIASTPTEYLLFEAAILLEKQNRQPALLASINEARKKGAKTVFNLQGSYSWKTLSVLPRDMAQMSDIIIGNETEMAVFQEYLSPHSQPSQIIITTQGEKGAVLSTEGKSLHVQAEPVTNIVDSIGAGDQFLAGFLHGRILGLPLEECLKSGAKEACSILHKQGGRPNARLNLPHDFDFGLS